ncbi:MAG: hypothetical protein Q7T05_03100 [Dehalococcoidia bacterium]|nr:hypothetical protein [Dehalococcoidia bacterium]
MTLAGSGWPGKLGFTIGPPLLAFAMIAVGLRLFGALPGAIQRPPVESFATVQEAQKAGGFPITLPRYFPDYFSWPPARVEISRRPYLGVSLGFNSRDSVTESLWIYQIASDRYNSEIAVPLPKYITQMQTLPLRDKMATLVVGATEAGMTVYQMRWTADGYKYVVATSYSLDELIKIAASLTR